MTASRVAAIASSLALGSLAVACARRPAETGEPGAGTRVHDASIAAEAGADAGAGASAPLPSLDDLADAGAPGARPFHRAELVLDGGASVALPEPERDLCVRALVAAERPIAVEIRGIGRSTAGGWVPDDGPVCLRRGERAAVSLSGSGLARLVVYRSP